MVAKKVRTARMVKITIERLGLLGFSSIGAKKVIYKQGLSSAKLRV